MINNYYLKIIFFLILIILSILTTLNYTVKIPNDGVLYLTSAKYFLETNILIDVTRTIDENIYQFPTTQIGSTLILIFFLYFFKSFWVLSYVIVLSFIWIILLKKLYKFSLKSFLYKKKFSIILPFLIFFNYDYLISASSFYNEAFYYPFLIFSFLKISNGIEKNKSFFKKSILFSIFLCVGSIFRIQHIVFISAISIYLLTQKKFKDFFISILIIIINIVIINFTFQYLSGFDISSKLDSITNTNPFHFIDIINLYFQGFYNSVINFDLNNSNILFKNLKVHFTMYINFTNLPKLVNIALPENLKKVDELLYFISSLIIFTIIVKYLFKTELNKIKIFFIIYIILTSIFLFFLTDLISRYFLFTNFCIIYFLKDNFKTYRYLINSKIIYSGSISFFVLILTLYGWFYFLNYKKNTYMLLKNLEEFKYNRDGFFSDNEIFLSKYSYHNKWIINKPTIRLKNFMENYDFESNKKYFFIGSKKEFYSSEYFPLHVKIKKLENYLYTDINSEEPGIWRIYIK